MKTILFILVCIFNLSLNTYADNLPKFSYDDSDDNLNRMYKLIMSNQKLLKKSKYLNYSRKGKYKNDKIKTMALAVYINYEEELTKLTNDKYLEEIPVLAWGWEYSELDNNYYNGSRAVIECDKDVIKKKLNNDGSKCIVVDFRRITGDSQYPITWENYLFKEREVKRLIAINIEKNNEIKKIEEKKKKELALVAQKKAEDEKARKEKEQKLLAEKQKTDELEKINKKLSLFNETELEKNQKIIDYTKKFIELYPDEFDILEIAKKILNVRPISDGNLNDEVLTYLNELRNYTSKSKKFSDYEKNIIKKENDQKVKTVDNELKILNEKIIVSKEFLAKNIDSIYAAELIELISNSEKIYFNPNSLQEIRKKNEDLNNLITQINNLNEKIKLTNDLNFLLKDKLQKTLSSDLTPLLIEQIEKLEYVLNNLDINELENIISDTNIFIEEKINKTKNTENLKKVNKNLEKVDVANVNKNQEKIEKSNIKNKDKDKIVFFDTSKAVNKLHLETIENFNKTYDKLIKELDLILNPDSKNKLTMSGKKLICNGEAFDEKQKSFLGLFFIYENELLSLYFDSTNSFIKSGNAWGIIQDGLEINIRNPQFEYTGGDKSVVIGNGKFKIDRLNGDFYEWNPLTQTEAKKTGNCKNFDGNLNEMIKYFVDLSDQFLLNKNKALEKNIF